MSANDTINKPHDQQRPPYPDGPRLLADVGGTNARFALESAPGKIDSISVLPCADYASFGDALAAYLHASGQPAVRHAAIAIANPINGDDIRMTNHHWSFSIEATRKLLGLDTMLVVNDFTALARSIPGLAAADCRQVGGGSAVAGGVIGLLGAGTGLGVGGLVPFDGRWKALSTEGGHVSFSPRDPREMAVLDYWWRTYEHVSAERLISGPGIELIYQALAVQRGVSAVEGPLDTAAICARALSGSDPLCAEVIECFCAMLGTVAANLAVTLGAAGGIYIGGGVVPRLGDYFARSPFRARFESKGRFSGYIAQIPTIVITAPSPAFIGVSAILSEHLGALPRMAPPERIERRGSADCAPYARLQTAC